VEIELKPKMHVYAPGVEGGYISVDWKVPNSPSWTAQKVQFPPSRKVRLDAIDETVPVYEGRARFVRDLVVGTKAAAGSITVEGSFSYQACDDRMCYVPRTVPLKWTFRVDPLDSERVAEELQKKAKTN
jgi:Thiol:disulfide interchange protein DsbD, N-terminal